MEHVNDVLACGIYNVSIVVDGEKVPQYGLEYEESEEGPKASCWIPSTAGKEFAIHCERPKNGVCYTIKVLLDERQVTNECVREDKEKKVVSNTWVSDSEARSFSFANLDLTDDDTYLENPPRQNIGTIKLILHPVTYLGDSQLPPIYYAVPDASKVHERSKKGLTHRVAYGPPIKSRWTATRCNVSYIGKPVTILFKYRPLEMLQATGVVPRIRSQSEEEDMKPEIIDLESEDEEAKEKELLAQLEAVRNRKRAKQNSDGPRKRVKTEPVRHFMPGEVIDLTL